MFKRKRRLAITIAALCLMGTITGCFPAKNENRDTASEAFKFEGYPVKNETTLTYWSGLNLTVSASVSNLGDTKFAKELEKVTGIKVKYIHPIQGQEKDQLNIMLASNELPDIIENNWFNFPGGPAMALQQGFILELNSIIEKDSPNLKKYLNENPEIDKMVKTDDGKYYAYPFIRGDDKLTIFNGPMVRKDWLDELGLQVPETLEDWHNMLVAFKEKKKSAAPLAYVSAMFAAYLNYGDFIGAYGIVRNTYVEDGKVKFGATTPEYKQFLDMMANWYAEGLIDKNIGNIDAKALDYNILSGKTGATISFAGSGLGKWIDSASDQPGFNLVPVPYPVKNRGEKSKFGQKDPIYSADGSASITSSCKNKELAARLLDYGYGEKGNRLYNFGIEGESYHMTNGYPTYTDTIMKNPNKLTFAHALGQYSRSGYFGPFVQAKEYIEQYYTKPQQQQALKVWGNTDAVKHMLPRITYTPDESKEYSSIINNIDTYIEEYSLKVIMGSEKTNNFDEFVKQLEKYGVDKIVSIQQAALERYNKR